MILDLGTFGCEFGSFVLLIVTTAAVGRRRKLFR